MTDGDFDPALAGPCPQPGPQPGPDDGLEEAVELPDACPPDESLPDGLDRKAADGAAGEALAEMLTGMTRELREQMQMFQRLRRQTDRKLAELEQADAGAEIDRKAAQADAKAAIEAMALIVRTLEKIDSLQRTLAQDRDRRDEEMLDDAGYQALIGRTEALVEQRAAERAREAAERAEATPMAGTGAGSGGGSGGPEGGKGDPGG